MLYAGIDVYTCNTSTTYTTMSLASLSCKHHVLGPISVNYEKTLGVLDHSIGQAADGVSAGWGRACSQKTVDIFVQK